ncbi:MAG: ABC transporter ATP-binding protein [Pseudomonadota bacterium]
MTAPVLEAIGLSKHFGGLAAVDDVSFALAPGEKLAIIGPNGAGKSTCFNMLMGQLKPTAGEVRLDGQRITGLSPRAVWRRGVGRTFQITATYPSMTVVENVQMALMSHYHGLFALAALASRQHRAEAEALLARVGMAAQAERHAAILAYGDLKRLELAVALAGTPKLLLMDEPTAGMAPAERASLMGLVDETVAERGISVLFTEHDMDVVFGHADRILVLNRGHLIAEGDAETVRADPKVQAVYLGGGVEAAADG